MRNGRGARVGFNSLNFDVSFAEIVLEKVENDDLCDQEEEEEMR